VSRFGPWGARKWIVTAVFVATTAYGSTQFLGGSPSSRSPIPGVVPADGKTMCPPAATACRPSSPSATAPTPAPAPVELSEELVRQADLWQSRAWGGADPFSGYHWAGARAPRAGTAAPADADTVLLATSDAPDGWNALVGKRVVRVGDSLLGGVVASISSGEVVVRGPFGERVLRFRR
jgi:hypothetical protein